MGSDFGLVGYWKMKDGSGTTSFDSSGIGNNGSLGGGVVANMPLWTEKGLRFDGTNDYIDCGNSNSLNITNRLTIESWFNINYGLADKCIVSKSLTGVGDNQYGVYFWNITNSLVINMNGSMRAFSAGDSIISGIYHMAVVWDKVNIIIYLNGQVSGSSAYSTSLTPTSYSVNIGRFKPNTKLFDGSIYELRIYNRALSAAEVIRHYNSKIYKYISK